MVKVSETSQSAGTRSRRKTVDCLFKPRQERKEPTTVRRLPRRKVLLFRAKSLQGLCLLVGSGQEPEGCLTHEQGKHCTSRGGGRIRPNTAAHR